MNKSIMNLNLHLAICEAEVMIISLKAYSQHTENKTKQRQAKELVRLIAYQIQEAKKENIKK